jgi:hypothetical protein
MSIIRMLTRLTAVAALRGQTWADDRVFDSDNTPLAQALTLNAAAKPYIVVFTDADNRLEVNGTDLYSVRRELNLVLEIGVASKIQGKTGDAEIKTPLTDEGMELALDMVEDQAFAVLFGDPNNEWTELFKCFVMRIDRVSGQRGASSDRDRRWAARQLSVICDVVADLPPGVPVSVEHPISLFSQVAKRNPEAHMEHAGEICDALIARTAAPDWERVQATLGVRRLGLRAIGLAPLSSDLPDIATQYGDDLTDSRGEAPILREIKHDDIQMEGDEETGLIDEYAISTNVVTVKAVDKKDKVVIDGEGDQP